MRESQILLRVELPNALPIMISGLRNGALQVIATATVAAYVGLGGLGRFLFDGLGSYDYGQMLGGAILVAVLAVVVDALLLGIERLTVSRGVSGRFRTRDSAGTRPPTGSPSDPLPDLPPDSSVSAETSAPPRGMS
jgi:osmoprotectant transport system permease protein